MKKLAFNWLAVLLAVVLSVGFSSCKDDDDDDNDGGGGGAAAGSIVGTWRQDFSSGYVLITFDKDGTGREQEYDTEDGGLAYSDSFSWAQDGNSIFLRYEDGYRETYTDVTVSSNTLRWTDEDGYTDTYVRQ